METNSQVLEMYSSSTEVNKLFEALAKAQGKMKPAVMDMKNPHYNSRYASLTSCQDAYRGPIAENNLSLTQQIFSFDEKYFCRSVLGHSSGQWISNVFRILLDRSNMQGLGSAITYARRYGANALIGVVDTEDDDGNASVAPPQEKRATDSQKAQGSASKFVSEPQLKRLFAISNSKGWTHEELKMYLMAAWGIETTKDLDRVKYDQIIKTIETKSFAHAIEDLGPKKKSEVEQELFGESSLLEELHEFVEENQMSVEEVKKAIQKCTNSTKKSTELTTEELSAVLKYLRMIKT